MIWPKPVREQMIFTYWLDKQVLKKRGITATQFLRMCEEGKVPGFEPGSDTVTGSGSCVEPENQREETSKAISNPGSVTAQPGPSTSFGSSTVGRSPI